MEDHADQGHRTFWVDNKPWFLLWRTGAAGRAVYIAAVSSFAPTIAGMRISLRDAEGRRMVGDELNGRPAAVRTAGETGLPWTVAIQGMRANLDKYAAEVRQVMAAPPMSSARLVTAKRPWSSTRSSLNAMPVLWNCSSVNSGHASGEGRSLRVNQNAFENQLCTLASPSDAHPTTIWLTS
jgi:hypothetical protein